MEPVDDRVISALHGYALAGVRSCTVLQKLCTSFVENELFKDKVAPPRSRRRFYPSLSDIRNFLYKSKEELRKAQSTLNQNQLLSQLGVDVASTSTAPPGDEGIDSTGIVALMNAAVQSNQCAQQGTSTSVSAAPGGDATGQQSTVSAAVVEDAAKQQSTVLPTSQIVPVQVMKAQTLTQMQSSSQSSVVLKETLTQTQAFTKPIEQSSVTPQSLPQLTSAPVQSSTLVNHTTSQYMPQGALTMQNTQQVSTTAVPQQMSVQPQPQNHASSNDFDTVEIHISSTCMSSETQEVANPMSLQHQVANTLEELARLPVHTQQIHPATTAVEQTQQAQAAKPSRLRLILKLKDLTRQIHDYALLIQGTDNLERLASSLESVVEQASEFCAVQPGKSKTRKRKAPPPVPALMPKVTMKVQRNEPVE